MTVFEAFLPTTLKLMLGLPSTPPGTFSLLPPVVIVLANDSPFAVFLGPEYKLTHHTAHNEVAETHTDGAPDEQRPSANLVHEEEGGTGESDKHSVLHQFNQISPQVSNHDE